VDRNQIVDKNLKLVSGHKEARREPIKMALTELHSVLSLRSSIRNPVVSSDVVPLIEHIHRLLNIRSKLPSSPHGAAPAPLSSRVAKAAVPSTASYAPSKAAVAAPAATKTARTAWDLPQDAMEWRTVESRSHRDKGQGQGGRDSRDSRAFAEVNNRTTASKPAAFASAYGRRGGSRVDALRTDTARSSPTPFKNLEAETTTPMESPTASQIATPAASEPVSRESSRPSSTCGSPSRIRPSQRAAPRDRYRGGGPAGKYVSKFKRSADNVDDTIVNTILLGKLNKFSPSNYDDIKEFITHIIDSGQTEMIKCFMKIVFEKAASEEIFCPLYARLLGELSAVYPVLLGEMAHLYEQYMSIFEEIPTGDDKENNSSIANYDDLCKRNVEKKYRRGYSQFLAELIQHNVIDTTALLKIIHTIVRHVENHQSKKANIALIEEYADCLMKVVKATTRASAESEAMKIIRDSMKVSMLDRLQPLTVRVVEREGLSNKARFTFLDMTEAIQRF